MDSRTPEVAARVLVLGDESRIMLPIVRSLGRQGVEVHVGWCPKHEPALKSRYIGSIHSLLPYGRDDQPWQDELLQLAQQHQFDLVIPATDGAVYAIQKNRNRFEPAGNFLLLDDKVFDITWHKDKTHHLAMELAIEIPQTRVIKTGDELDQAVSDFGFPLIVKPITSVNQLNRETKDFVLRADSVEVLSEIVTPKLEQGAQFLVQEFVAGTGVGVGILAEQGEILAAFQHERIHETSGFGSTYRKSVPLTPELLDATRKVVKALNYSGVLMSEFRVSQDRVVLLELNARFWGSVALPVAAGIDFPWYLYQNVCRGRREFPSDYRADVRCRNVLNDIRWTWRSLKGRYDDSQAFAQGWAINRMSRGQTLNNLLRWLTWQDHSDMFAADDVRPALAEFTRLGRAMFSRE